MKPLSIDGAWEFTPRVHADPRGAFLEAYRTADLPRPFDTVQVNCSVSKAGVLRGVHFADVPPGQAKYVMCVSGAILDVVVDLREGSPDFGRWEAVRLDSDERRAVLIAEGLGHAFLALSEQATVLYLCSSGYNPGGEHGVHPLDPDLGITWPVDEPLLSDKDAAAPTLKAALESGLLPSYVACQKFYAGLH
ncbi:dTDP-4-dehydrorhamnose 3,5-epimerase family protein [Nonomuraea sp. NPDC059023]|uniref:dTDP-4-dehydrorhamnose 3,5-epimerase family protein n=1 Tax=unclassified Nonomuraea TaxID=2593643 RepID=UPI0036761263